MAGILNGIRVLDLSRYIAGPWCGLLLADLGAEVIKVEKAGVGDETRTLGPWKNGKTLYYPAFNRNKKSVTVNFRDKKGVELIKGLIKESDVLLENFRPGTMKKMGLDYSEVKKINPRIVMASVSGYGQVGPYAERPAFDSIIEAMSGMMRYKADSSPTYSRGPVMDTMGAMYACLGIVLALYNRVHTGRGQYIDQSMYAAGITIRQMDLMNYEVTGEQIGESTADSAPYGFCKAKDGWVNIHAGSNERIWARCCKLIGPSRSGNT